MKFLVLIITMALTLNVLAAPKISEVNIEEVFVAPVGYDSNDNVEIIVDGKLPNACYELYKTDTEIKGFNIYVKQYIKIKQISECRPENQSQHTTPLWPVQYTNRIEIGELVKGKYSIIYNTNFSQKMKTFVVSKSVSSSIDDDLYAPVSNAFIPELIYSTSNAQVILTGIMTNTCMSFQGDVKVIRHDNVFIILPKMSVHRNRVCTSTMEPLQHIVSLGEVQKEGRYLIHVRSTTGRSVNKLFSVKTSPFDPTGR
jgi:hypothetical protein